MKKASQAWNRLHEQMRLADYRDMSDWAHHWADDLFADDSTPPRTMGEWKANMTIAFEAGMRWAQRLAADEGGKGE